MMISHYMGLKVSLSNLLRYENITEVPKVPFISGMHTRPNLIQSYLITSLIELTFYVPFDTK